MTEIAADNAYMFLQFQSKVTGATTKIQSDRARTRENVIELANRETPPDLVDIGGEKMVEAVVAWRNFCEHRTDSFGLALGIESGIGHRCPFGFGIDRHRRLSQRVR